MTALVTESVELPGGRFQLLRGGTPAQAAPWPPLAIVLHGFPDHPPTFAPVIERLVAAGYEVAAPWLRGYAPSTLDGPFGIERLVADVLELATALGRERFALVGHDWGAVITYAACGIAPGRVRAAVTMAVPHPRAFLRSLLRTGQLARSWYMLFFQLPGAAAAVEAGDFAVVDLLWRRWSRGYRMGEEERRALKGCLRASMPAPIEYYRAAARGGREVRAAALRPIVTPLLHLQGGDDGCIAPSASEGEERSFRGPFASEVLAGVGHFMHVEAPGEVAARAIAWLRQHDEV